MGAIPGDLDIDVDKQPHMRLPLQHFVVGLLFLILSGVLGVVFVLTESRISRTELLGVLHLLLIGWVCITIIGAMTQFVPVWSSVNLHSQKLARLQLLLVTVGVAGMSGGFITNQNLILPIFGVLVVLGFWTFVYNIGRSLPFFERKMDITEFHFSFSLIFFLLLTVFGYSLALNRVFPSLLSSHRLQLLSVHATFAVYGAVLTTILGALYQLGTMFTQTELYGIDHYLRKIEKMGYPSGVFVFAVGNLTQSKLIAVLGGLMLVLSILSFGAILLRRVYHTQVDWTPIIRRYALVGTGMLFWSVLFLPNFLSQPLDTGTLFGSSRAIIMLFIGVIGLTLMGTLYHVIPFIIWVHTYSDRLGFEPVPLVDDLYSERMAKADIFFIVGGAVCLFIGEGLGEILTTIGVVLVTVGAFVFVFNMFRTVHNHSPYTIVELLSLKRPPAKSADPDKSS